MGGSTPSAEAGPAVHIPPGGVAGPTKENPTSGSEAGGVPASAARQGYASATAGRLRFFQVSARGNGVGLTILRRQPAQEIGTAKESGTAQDTESEQGEKPGDSPDILLLHVLPKLWNRDWYETRVARLPRASEVGVEPGERGQLPGTLQLVIHEQQILALEPEWARSLEQVASDTLLDWDAPREAGQGDGGEALADVAPATEAPDAPDGPGTSGGSDTPDGTRTAPPETATGPNRGAQGGGVVGSDAEDGEKDPLWREVALTARLRGTLREDLPALPRADGTAGPADPVSLLWSVIDHVQGEPATGADRRDPPAGGVDLLPDLPGLEQIVYRQLLARTEDALQHRRPTFLPVTEELAFVRGRMDPQGLIRRTARRRLPVLCEFDSLSADSALWQTVRGAVQIVASEAKAPEDRERALTCDAQLRDVTVEPAHVLLASGVPPAQLQRMPVETRLAYRYARAVLARRHGVDPEESTHTAGVLVNLKYPSSVLWERLVGEYLRAALGRSEMTVTEQYRLNVFFRDPDAPGSDGEWKAVSAKRPDLVVLGPPADEPGGDGRPLLVVDAKYKRWPEDGFTGASMGDQYQLATYAYRLDVDAFLAHPVVTQPQEKSVDTLVLADPGAPALQAVGATRAERPHVGSLALPFPAPKGWSLTECTERAVRMLRDGPLEGLLRRIL